MFIEAVFKKESIATQKIIYFVNHGSQHFFCWNKTGR